MSLAYRIPPVREGATQLVPNVPIPAKDFQLPDWQSQPATVISWDQQFQSGTYDLGWHKFCVSSGAGDSQITAYNGNVYPVAGPGGDGYYAFRVSVSGHGTSYLRVTCYRNM